MMTVSQESLTSPSLAGGSSCTTQDSMDTGKKETHRFFHKWLSRPHSSSKPVATQINEELAATKCDRLGELVDGDEKIMPCPYIRPLKSKLQPRVESAPHARRPGEASVFSSARKKGVAHNYITSSGTDEESSAGVTSPNAMSLRSLRLREDIAAAAAADSAHLKEWGYYIKCYSEGSFNLILPPGPPPMRPDFTYLPSTYPPNEAERLALFQSSDIWSGIDIIWTPVQAERARGLIKAAMAGFAAPWSAVSFFDLDNEIVQAERGYSRHLIPRRQSIASHVLLTNEVMTVLDAQQDWRFSGNPLVTEHPKIRFFAGAPLLSPTGEVIGVFSIFSPEPRASFTATQRRELTRFSEMAIKELTSPMKVTSKGSECGITNLQPSVVTSKVPRFGNLSSVSAPLEDSPHSGLGSPALWYHKPSRDYKPKSRVFINVKKKGRADPTSHTPPESEKSGTGPFSCSAHASHPRKILKELMLNTDTSQSRDSLDTPDSPTFGYCFPHFGPSRPRAFSGSNITSVGQESNLYSSESQNMNTPSLSSDCSANVIEAFSFDETALLLASPPSLPNIKTGFANEDFSPVQHKHDLLGAHPELFDQCFDTRGNSFATSEAGESVGDIGKENLGRVWNDGAMANSYEPGDVLSEEPGQSDQYAEAKSATEVWAKQLGFDIIYAVELIPRKLFMTDLELQGPGGIETRVLVSYGLPEDIDFDIAMHLSVLKGSGGMTWENEQGKPEDFRRGFMMPLPFDFGMLEYRSKGVVFGAFRKKANDCATLPKLDAADIRRLRKAARSLRKILHKVPTLRRPNYGMVEHEQSPTRQAYPTNEVTTMAKRLTDVELG